MKVVVDASLLIEGLDPDSPLAERAADLRKRIARETLAAPALILWEIGNYVARMVAQTVNEDAANAGLATAGFVEDIVLDIPDARKTGRIIELAVRHGLTFYDASYLELATREPDSYLISQDGRLRRAGEKELGKPRSLDLEGARSVFKARL
ncbi:MAG TPA: type II toxin-antitoxin system VapC family toxin [Candidatus Thermoplasmatota archaeon]